MQRKGGEERRNEFHPFSFSPNETPDVLKIHTHGKARSERRWKCPMAMSGGERWFLQNACL